MACYFPSLVYNLIMRNVRSVNCEFQQRLHKDIDRLIAKRDRTSDYLKQSDLDGDIQGINVVLNACIDCSECGIQALYTSEDTGPETISENDCPMA